MIYNAYFLDNYSYFLIILDYHIIIIKENDYPKFQSFFDKIKDTTQFFFLNSKKKDVPDKKSTKINQTELSQKIIKKISKCIIKKSQIRTVNRHHELSPAIEKTKQNFDIHDFIHISAFSGNNVVKLCFNCIDQYLYVLKIFDSKNKELMHRFHHEIYFYENHNGKNPFICKFYGQIQTNYESIIVIEYIEGQTLQELIKNENIKLNDAQKMQIIFDIMCALEYLHLNNFIYRDLKTNNIIVDSKFNAILIDFDQLKEYDGSTMTSDVGSPLFLSPEQEASDSYSFETDIYSLGKIIHFILMSDQKDKNDSQIQSMHNFIMNTKTA